MAVGGDSGDLGRIGGAVEHDSGILEGFPGQGIGDGAGDGEVGTLREGLRGQKSKTEE